MSFDRDAVGLGGQDEQRQALVALLDVTVGARQQQDVVGDVSGRAPGLGAVDDPAAGAVVARGERAHRPEHIGAAPGLGEADRETRLAFGDRRQEPLLLLIAAVQTNRLGAGERGQPPHPGQPGQRSGQTARQQHLHEDVAALAAVLLRHRDAVEAGRRSTCPTARTDTRLSCARSPAPTPSGSRYRPSLRTVSWNSFCSSVSSKSMA